MLFDLVMALRSIETHSITLKNLAPFRPKLRNSSSTNQIARCRLGAVLGVWWVVLESWNGWIRVPLVGLPWWDLVRGSYLTVSNDKVKMESKKGKVLCGLLAAASLFMVFCCTLRGQVR